MTISDEYTKAIAEFPPALQDLVKAELAAGNSIVGIGHGDPAPINGSRVMLAKPLLSRPRASDAQLKFYERNCSSHSGQITDAARTFYVVEAPLPPPPEEDMNAIRAELKARERASDNERWDATYR